jgi:acetyl esterase/lipase
MWIAAGLAIARATVSRLLLGPTLPSWTWRTEWAVAGARAIIEIASEQPDDPFVNQLGLRVRAPVPPSLHSLVRVHRVKLGALTADSYIRLSDPIDQATLLYFHGGGYIFGNPGTHRQFIAHLVESTHTAAYAPLYRLAPQHRFPAAVEDGIAAYEALLERGIDPAKLIVCGDSAGGGLTLATLHRARRMGIPMPGGVILFSPYLDLNHTAYTIPVNAATDYLPLAELSKPNDRYASPEQLDNPEVSPLFADLSGFPRMLIFAGGAEMLLDDAVRLKDNADAAGVDATLIVEDEMMHVWPAIAPWQEASRRTLDQCAQWVVRTT